MFRDAVTHNCPPLKAAAVDLNSGSHLDLHHDCPYFSIRWLGHPSVPTRSLCAVPARFVGGWNLSNRNRGPAIQSPYWQSTNRPTHRRNGLRLPSSLPRQGAQPLDGQFQAGQNHRSLELCLEKADAQRSAAGYTSLPRTSRCPQGMVVVRSATACEPCRQNTGYYRRHGRFPLLANASLDCVGNGTKNRSRAKIVARRLSIRPSSNNNQVDYTKNASRAILPTDTKNSRCTNEAGRSVPRTHLAMAEWPPLVLRKISPDRRGCRATRQLQRSRSLSEVATIKPVVPCSAITRNGKAASRPCTRIDNVATLYRSGNRGFGAGGSYVAANYAPRVCRTRRAYHRTHTRSRRSTQAEILTPTPVVSCGLSPASGHFSGVGFSHPVGLALCGPSPDLRRYVTVGQSGDAFSNQTRGIVFRGPSPRNFHTTWGEVFTFNFNTEKMKWLLQKTKLQTPNTRRGRGP